MRHAIAYGHHLKGALFVVRRIVIENDYVYQLDPYKYDLIPDSEIRLFDSRINALLS